MLGHFPLHDLSPIVDCKDDVIDASLNGTESANNYSPVTAVPQMKKKGPAAEICNVPPQELQPEDVEIRCLGRG